jgi:hypothetical protein
MDVDARFRPAEKVRAAATRAALGAGLDEHWLNDAVKHIGAEFQDEEDVRLLLRLLDVRSRAQALSIITKYCPLERFPQKTLYALEDLLPKGPA